MRRGFTLLEMIFVVVISGILSIGSFKAFSALYIRSAKAKAVTDLSFQSQVVLDQLSVLIYNRIPNSVIGYDGVGDCDPIEELDGNNVVLEWLGLADDALFQGLYDGFVDMNASTSPVLSTPNLLTSLNATNMNLIFAGAFDDGSEDVAACSGAFGWHGAGSSLSHGFSIPSANHISFNAGDVPNVIYEKYYLSSGAYAVTRGEDITDISNCGLNESDFRNFDTTLFLFYEYYPYNGETYCGDGGSGKVVVLAEDVSGFRASYVNDTIVLSIDMNRSIRGSTAVHVSKQKAVF